MGRKIASILFVCSIIVLSLALIVPSTATTAQDESDCITCHREESPGIVDQWLTAKMSTQGLDCATCHGAEHVTDTDWDKAVFPTPDTCNSCHMDKVAQYRDGKHSLAWAAMQAMPAFTHLSTTVGGPDGFKGCSGCHKIGEKPADQIASPEFVYGTGSCDSCHTRHAFSKAEAQDPRACQTCHMGFDHPQWEMWSTAKHGTIWQIENEAGGDTSRAPTCQTCHYQDGNHSVLTPWGFLALRVPEDDADWWADRVEILKALGVLDAAGEGTERLEVVAQAKVARLTKEEFDAERAEMVEVCLECHADGFAAQQMAAGDQIIKEADAMMAEAIDIVQSLYLDGIIQQPEGWDYAPDLLQFFEAETDIEQELFRMFLEYRNRAFMGAFHANPDYMFWYGYAEMQDSLQTIKDDAETLRKQAEPAPISPVVWVALGVGLFGMLAGVAAYTRRRT